MACDATAPVDAASAQRARALVASLDPVRRCFLELTMDGYSLINIAAELGAPLEYAVHLQASVMKDLGARRTADLVRIALQANLSS